MQDWMKALGEPMGQSWVQFVDLGIALVLSALIGMEREYRQKSAGLRTYSVVGVAACLMMLISKYGFTDILSPDRIMLDPSRVAAQVVTGIGFIGGGLIFMRRDIVRGLTTAAIVWLTAGIGMACGAGLPLLALAVTGAHFAIVFVFPFFGRMLPRAANQELQIRITYEAGRGILRQALASCTGLGFSVSDMNVDATAGEEDGVVGVSLVLRGTAEIDVLTARLQGIGGVLSVHASDVSDPIEQA
jgi:putative Mg2+ transporter-C (MgtC) family protein